MIFPIFLGYNVGKVKSVPNAKKLRQYYGKIYTTATFTHAKLKPTLNQGYLHHCLWYYLGEYFI